MSTAFSTANTDNPDRRHDTDTQRHRRFFALHAGLFAVLAFLAAGGLFVRHAVDTIDGTRSELKADNAITNNAKLCAERNDSVHKNPFHTAPADTTAVPAAQKSFDIIAERLLAKWKYPDTDVLPGGPVFYIFILLDDAGARVDQLKDFYTFPRFSRLTFAVLPHLQASVEVARELDARNTAYILHMPMQPVGLQNPGPGALFVKDSRAVINTKVVRAMNSLPNIMGINNHMGSYATQSKPLVDEVLTVARERGLFFLDSVTTGKSIAGNEAMLMGLLTAKRDVFLDNEQSVDYIIRQLQHAVDVGRDKGYVIAIGHATKPEMAEALTAFYDRAVVQGGRFASLRDYWHLVEKYPGGGTVPRPSAPTEAEYQFAHLDSHAG